MNVRLGSPLLHFPPKETRFYGREEREIQFPQHWVSSDSALFAGVVLLASE